MKNFTLTILATLLAANYAHSANNETASIESSLAQCAAGAHPATRLECYDNLVKQPKSELNPSSEGTEPATKTLTKNEEDDTDDKVTGGSSSDLKGPWYDVSSIDEMTDKPIKFIVNFAIDNSSENEEYSLFIRWKELTKNKQQLHAGIYPKTTRPLFIQNPLFHC